MVSDINLDYLLEYINKLDAGTITIEQLINELCLKFSSEYNIPDTPELRQTLMNIIVSYQNKAISSEYFTTLLKEVIIANGTIQEEEEETSYGGSYSGGNGNSSGSSGTVIEIVPDVVIGIANKLEEHVNAFMGAGIDVSYVPAGHNANTITTTVDNVKSTIEGSIGEIKQNLINVVNAVTSLDEDMTFTDINDVTFAQIKAQAEKAKEYQLQEAEKEFFENNGCTINGDYAILTVDGKECKYNLKTHKFYVEGKESIQARIYIPGGSSLSSDKLKTLDTYTCFTAGGNATKGRDSEAIVIEIKREGDKYTKYSETAYLTKFINQVADNGHKERSDGTKTKNIIGGDSVYGTHSLKITAENTDVYDTVYCINSPVIVTGENGTAGNKTQFASLDDLKKLDGKEIYMIYTSGDDNFKMSKNGNTDYKHGYTYTGLELLRKTCPNSEVYVVYNDETNADNHEVLIGLLKDLDNGSNFHYSPELWYKFANARYSSHHGGTELIIDSVKATGNDAPGSRA